MPTKDVNCPGGHSNMFEALRCIACQTAHATTQPAPVPNARPAVWGLVIADMKERDQLGRQRYGTPLQAYNGRDALVDAYQEALDLAVYLRQVIEERGHERRAHEPYAGPKHGPEQDGT